ncbi:MAG: radical SAM protein [Bacteroidetes bacterium]|nr:MAG: radical SAM protein [Bacteroidota bacterium]
MIINPRNYFQDSLSLLKKITPGRFWNYIKILFSYKLSRIRKHPYIWAGPFSLSFETASVCNLKCAECMAGQGKVIRNRKLMKPEVALEKLELHRQSAFYCNLYFQGEPFLHPEIYAIIRSAAENKYYSVISTNGHFLDEKNCREIIESGLSRLIVSLDGLEQETYETYRKGGSFEKVAAGILRLSEMKKEVRSPHPFLVVQFLVNKTNEHQMGDVEKYVRTLGADKLDFKSMQIYTERGIKEFSPLNKKYNRYKDGEKGRNTLSGCFRLWSHMVYTSDGEVVPCCYDKIPEYSTGSTESSPRELWKSPAMQDFRKVLLAGEQTPSICSNCGG